MHCYRDILLLVADIDECTTTNTSLQHTCDPNANCGNTPGSYNCYCYSGYSGDGFSCTGELSIGVRRAKLPTYVSFSYFHLAMQ